MALLRFSNESFRGWVHPHVKLPQSLTEAWDAEPSLPGSKLILDCQGRQIYRVELELSGCSHSCFVYLFRNQSVSRSLRRTHAFHILQIAEKMRREGIQTLEVLAALKPKNETLNWRSLLIASEIASVNELPSAGNHVFQVHESVQFDELIASTLARELARFHDRKFIHGDLKSRHILAKEKMSAAFSRNGISRFHFVDLEKSQHHPHLPKALLDILSARDLVQLFSSLPADSKGESLEPVWSRFLAEYFSERKLSKVRISLMQRILALYSPEGSLSQGQTLFDYLAKRLRMGSAKGRS